MIPHSARSIARRAALTTAAIIGAVVLAGGTATAAPTGATAETSSVGVAASCGLSGEMKKHPVPGWNWYYYNIRNCHSYTVWRQVNVTNSVTRDGRCHYIPAGGTVSSRLEMYTQFDTVLGLKAC